MHNHLLCVHFVELSLCNGESLAGPGCFCWKSNWTKFDHLGSTGGHWETVSGIFSIPFVSGLEVPSYYASNFSFSPWYNLREDKFYLSLIICELIDFHFKLDQIYCAWLIKWVIKREIIQLAELCLTRWWIISGSWWVWVSMWRYWLVLGQLSWYCLVLGGTGSAKGLYACIYWKKWRFGRVLPMPHSQTDNRI